MDKIFFIVPRHETFNHFEFSTWMMSSFSVEDQSNFKHQHILDHRLVVKAMTRQDFLISTLLTLPSLKARNLCMSVFSPHTAKTIINRISNLGDMLHT